MSQGLVALLVVLWAGVLLPGAWRDHRRSPVATVDHFTEAMRRLSGSDEHRPVVVPGRPGRRVVHPPGATSRRLRARRRAVLGRLAALAGGTTLLALVVGGGLAWTLALLSLAALAGYVVMLRSIAVRTRQARGVVRAHPAVLDEELPAPVDGPPADARPVDRAVPPAVGEWR